MRGTTYDHHINWGVRVRTAQRAHSCVTLFDTAHSCVTLFDTANSCD